LGGKLRSQAGAWEREEKMENKNIFPLTDEELAELLGRPVGTIKNKRFILIKEQIFEKGIHYELKRKDKVVNRRYDNYVYTELGAIEIAKKLNNEKAKIFLENRGANLNKGVRIEHDYIDFIVTTLQGIAECRRQHRVELSGFDMVYKIDLYLPEYGIAIECDETHHKGSSNQVMDLIRQKLIENDKGYEFVRFNPEEKKFDFGKVLNKIFKKVMEDRKNRNT
jgi:very-short-patch-repair endonuclease